MKKEKKERTPAELKRRKKKRNRIIIAVVIVLLIVIRLVACGGSGKETAIVSTATPLYGDVEETINVSGLVDSEETKVYFSQVNGRIADIKVEEGDAVNAGDTLMLYDMDMMQNRLEEANLQAQVSEANYNGVMAQSKESQGKMKEADVNLEVLKQQIKDEENYIKVLQESLEKQQRDTGNALAAESYNLNQRISTLTSELGKLTPGTPEYEKKSGELEKAQAQLARNQYISSVADSAEGVLDLQKKIQEEQEKLAGYQSYKAEMESQKVQNEPQVLDSYGQQVQNANYDISVMNLEKVQEEYVLAEEGVKAEFNGIVTEVTTVSGATVGEGTGLLTLKNSDKIKVVISVGKYDLQKIKVGQKADVTISGKVYTGTVEKIDRMATVNASGSAVVEAEIHIDQPDKQVYLGMEAKVEIHTHKAEHVLLLPIEAVNADRDGDFVYVAENGVIVKKAIVTGISSDTYIEVKEGLTETDNVVVSSYSNIEEGMAVVVMPVQ